MTHGERTMAALKGRDVDRPPISMWRHFFDQESSSAEGLAEAMLAFQRRYDWDFMKVNPRASYHAEGWGLRTQYAGNSPPQVVETPIREPNDWLKLEVSGLDRGVLAEQLHALELIAAGLNGEVPFLMTVFTPLSIAARLAPSEEGFLEHLREHTGEVQHALDVITETFSRFSQACLDRGASGLFYATTTWATTQRMTEQEYHRFARHHDLALLDALSGAEFNILHVCRDHNMLPTLADYPVHAFNWDARGQGNPGLREGKALLGERAAVGGLAHRRTLVQAAPEEVAGEVRGMRVAMGNRGWMLGPGCTFSPDTPEANIWSIRRAVEAD
jgi:uroporphyrinogen decarboxylase